MEEENIRQEFKLKNIDETKNYLTEEMNQNKLVNKQDKKICTTLKLLNTFFNFKFFQFQPVQLLDVFPFLLLLLYL